MSEEENETKTFEETMEALEAIVNKLEEGEVPLEKAIAMYQEGMKLSQTCHEKLQAVEEQMNEIMTEDGEVEPLTSSDEESST
ncbi:exodeoxyribonuclease VII small subunit [Salsuginibacillus halophilus]|uniref:Exodeoxyribonuclease 7 small subunit n=1 Tax=Salsuginibacillus halophilus TaxID=517424 RepID=A0A2P8HAK1_9BACI|nr:exodeoxyribonuclease VII small subunit [Salsuginibacillus halophilus]